MENSKTFEPVIWRLLIFRLIPFAIVWIGCDLIYKLYNHFPVTLLSLLLSSIAALIGAIIGVLLARKKFIIEILDNKISGPGGEFLLTREIYSIEDLEVPNFNSQSFYEKISGFYSIRSKSGRRIIFTPFIYGNAAKDKVHKAIMQSLSGEQR